MTVKSDVDRFLEANRAMWQALGDAVRPPLEAAVSWLARRLAR